MIYRGGDGSCPCLGCSCGRSSSSSSPVSLGLGLGLLGRDLLVLVIAVPLGRQVPLGVPRLVVATGSRANVDGAPEHLVGLPTRPHDSQVLAELGVVIVGPPLL